MRPYHLSTWQEPQGGDRYLEISGDLEIFIDKDRRHLREALAIGIGASGAGLVKERQALDPNSVACHGQAMWRCGRDWPSGGSWSHGHEQIILECCLCTICTICTNGPPNEVNKYLNPIAIAWPDFNFLNPVCSSDSFQYPDSIQGIFAYWTHPKGIPCQSTQLKLL